MKVKTKEKKLLIVPETEFESEFLQQFCDYESNGKVKGFLKSSEVEFNNIIGLELSLDKVYKND